LFLSGFISLVACPPAMVAAEPQLFFPDTGTAAVHQRALDARARFRVLAVSVRPGCEDLAALAYLRLGRGARVASVYVSNGEATESTVADIPPRRLAAIRRAEADGAMRALEAEAHFLNLPDVRAADDSPTVRSSWPGDAVHARLLEVFRRVKPDMIILARDRVGADNPSAAFRHIERSVLAAVKELSREGTLKGARVLAETESRTGIGVRTGALHPVWMKTYAALSEEIANRYESCASRHRESPERERRYRIVHGVSGGPLRSIDTGLPARPTKGLQGIVGRVERVVNAKGGMHPDGRTLIALAALSDSINALLVRPLSASPSDERVLLDMNVGLDNLRNALLGVSVRYRFSETTLCARQLTEFTIDIVTGLTPGGWTEVYIPAVGRGWILNESGLSRVPFQTREPYRLVTPEDIPGYDLPAAEYGIERPTAGEQLYVFILHIAPARSRSFAYRIAQRIDYAPRFTTEALTPIVYARNEEPLIIRLANHTRDGVRDSVSVADSLLLPASASFRLSDKGSSEVDTLRLRWREPRREGTSLHTIQVGGVAAGHFASRFFPTAADSVVRVGLITGLVRSAADVALSRLGCTPSATLPPDSLTAGRCSSLDALLVDRDALSVSSDVQEFVGILERFAAGGGHVIVLPQESRRWNETPPGRAFPLHPSDGIPADAPLALDSISRFVRGPNELRGPDFDGWLFSRAGQWVEEKPGVSTDIPIRDARTRNPLVLSLARGKGRITYVALSLPPQWLNVNAGAHRLLANLLANGAESP
jgi:LmbE family N-acetylglucosaminyl deacetylase